MKIINIIKNALMVVGIVVGIASILLPAPVGAINVFNDACKNDPNSAVCKAQNGNNKDNLYSFITVIINTLYTVLAIAAVLVIVISGATFIMSNGDSALITAAKNRILYAVIGLIVATLAWALVSFIVEQLAKATQ